MKTYPSIFNDVLGPVMRGPSSSHCAAALRIGRICRDLMNSQITSVIVTFDPDGSLATTHKSQGSDMGLFSGLLGWEADDDRLPDYMQAIADAAVDIRFQIETTGINHPNTYKLSLFNDTEMRELTAISTGGGMIEVLEIDGAPVSMCGDYFETLIYTSDPEKVAALVQALLDFDKLDIHRGRSTFISIKAQSFPTQAVLEELASLDEVLFIRQIATVLPIMSRRNLEVPFITCEAMLAYNSGRGLALWELGLAYESARGNISGEEALRRMTHIVRIMQASVDQGLKGTQYEDRILGSQSTNFQQKMEQRQLIQGDVLNRIILFVSAIMEVKSSMGVIVAAPTAGSCGALPGAVLGAAAAMNLPEAVVVKAMLTAGVIGIFISDRATFAAEVGGCQAECGSGAGMAAAALVSMAGGSLEQSLAAASLALQNSLGMICDPIANRVEAPCLGRNIMAASNALSCANMALADYDHLIPLDEVIETMDKVGKSISNELRCTALGGLSITKTSKAIEERLNAGTGQESLDQTRFRFKIC